MAYGLVGTAAAVSQGAASAAVTPAWGTGQNRTANNLLTCSVSGTGVATLPTTPSGWTIGVQRAGTSCSVTVYWKVAAGSDAAPTIAAVTSAVWAVQLGEYSGNAPTAPNDQSGSGAGTTSPITCTCAAADTGPGDLVIGVQALLNSAARNNAAWSPVFNNGATATNVSNSGTSTVNHYGFSYGITTSNAAADTHTFTYTTTQLTGAAAAMISFKPLVVDVGTPATMTGTTSLTVTGVLPAANLQDGFTVLGTPDTTKWTASDANLTVVSRGLQITCPASTTTYHQLYSAPGGAYAYAYWNLDKSSVTIQVISVGNQSLASLEVYPIYLSNETLVGAGSANRVFWYINTGAIYAMSRLYNGSSISGWQAAWDPTIYGWLRIRGSKSDGLIYWETSPNGQTWTQRSNMSWDDIFFQTGIWLQAGTYNAEASGTTVIYDNLNLPPPLTAFGPVGANLLTGDNTEFEGGVGAWLAGTNTAIATTTAAAYGGTHSQQITATVAGNASTASARQTVIAGANYTVTGWVQAATTGRNCQLVVSFYNGGGTFLASLGTAQTADTTGLWTQVTATVTAPATAAQALVTCYVNSAALNEVHYLDSVVLQQAPGAVGNLTASGNTGAQTTLSGSAGMTVSASATQIAAVTLAGGAALNIPGALVTEVASVAQSATAGLTTNASLTMTASAFAPGPNVVPAASADFEDGSTGSWSQTNCTIANSTAQANTGTHSLAVTSTGTATTFPKTPKVAVSPNTAYYLSAWVRSATATRTVALYLNFYDSGNAVIGGGATSPGITSSTTGWKQAGFVLAPGQISPANAATCDVAVEFFNPAGAGEVHYIDTVVFQATAGALAGMTLTTTSVTEIAAIVHAGATTLTVTTTTVTEIASVVLAGTAGLSMTSLVAGQATLVATTNLTMAALVTEIAAVVEAAATTLSVAAVVSRMAATALAATAGMNVASLVIEQASVAMAAGTAMNLVGTRMVPASTTLSGTAGMSIGAPSVTEVAAVTLTGSTAMFVSGGPPAVGRTYSLAYPPNRHYLPLSIPAQVVMGATAGMGLQGQVPVSPVSGGVLGAGEGFFVLGKPIVTTAKVGATVLAATAALTVTARVTQVAAVTESATTSLTVAGVDVQYSTVAESATASLTVGGVKVTEVASVGLSATSGMTVAASVTQLANVVLAGGATLNLAGMVTQAAAVNLSASAALNVVGTAVNLGNSVALSATAGMAAITAKVTEVASVTMSAVTGLVASTNVIGIANLVGASTLTVAATVNEFAAVALSGSTTLTVTATLTRFGTVALSGTAALTVVGVDVGFGAVALSGVASLTITALVTEVATVALAASTTLTIAAQVTELASVALSALASLTAAAKVTELAVVALSGNTTLTVSAKVTQVASVALTGVTSLTVLAKVTQVASITMAGNASLTLSGMVLVIANVSMAATAHMVLAGYVTEIAAVNLAATTSLFIGAIVIEIASIQMEGDTTMTVKAMVIAVSYGFRDLVRAGAELYPYPAAGATLETSG